MSRHEELALAERLRAAVAEDLQTLAVLHEQELDSERLRLLRGFSADELLGITLQTEAAQAALQLFFRGVGDVPAALDGETLDRLAVEYADIYLNNSLSASPCESVWIDEDGLVMQAPMFQIRDWYQLHGLAVPNWRERSDDHLVHQLQFLAWHFAAGEGKAPLSEAGRFMDEHLLRWIDRFADRIATRCSTRLYAGLASLTAAYLHETRELIAQLTGVPIPSADEIDARMQPKAAQIRQAVAPPEPWIAESAPSW